MFTQLFFTFLQKLCYSYDKQLKMVSSTILQKYSRWAILRKLWILKAFTLIETTTMKWNFVLF